MIRVALIALVFFTDTTVYSADPPADEVEKLQGEWQAVGIEARGKKADKDAPEVKNMRFVFEGERITLLDPTGGGKDRKKTFTVDPAKSPKEMNVTSLDGQEKDQIAACIYKLDGDRLTICMPYFSKDPGTRPKQFKAGADDGFIVLTLDRVNDK